MKTPRFRSYIIGALLAAILIVGASASADTTKPYEVYETEYGHICYITEDGIDCECPCEPCVSPSVSVLDTPVPTDNPAPTGSPGNPTPKPKYPTEVPKATPTVPEPTDVPDPTDEPDRDPTPVPTDVPDPTPEPTDVPNTPVPEPTEKPKCNQGGGNGGEGCSPGNSDHNQPPNDEPAKGRGNSGGRP